MKKRKDNNPWQPESQDAMEATEAVINGAKKKKKNFFEANMFPLKGDTSKERARKVVFDLLILIMVASGLVLTWWVGIDPMMNRARTDQLLEWAGVDTPPPIYIDDFPVSYNDNDNEAVTQPPAPTAPTVTRTMSFDELIAINNDFVGWISAPGASIELPVVQTTNNDFYLYRDFWRRPSRYGNPFMDFRSRVTTEPHSTNLIIYGHHMRNMTIFSRLINYQNHEVVRRHPILTLTLRNGQVWQYKIFAVLTINGRPEHDNGFVFHVNTPDFPNQANFDGFVRQLRQRSLVNVDIPVTWGDYLLTLQTCVYDFPDQFLYVVGRRVRPGETATMSRDLITRNPTPRHPDELFRRRGQTNPFRDAERWFPGQ